MGKKIDLTGQHFGKWTVLYETSERDASGAILWHCKCDCGNESNVAGTCLRQGKTKSCGCLRKINAIGQRFGFLTVLNDTGLRNGGKIIWHCKCDCGNECDIKSDNLYQGYTRSCGCIGRSAGASLIDKILKENNISFQREFRFQDCRDKYPLPFDFYVDNKYIIEFDGLQHFKYQASGNGWNTQENFEKVQKHDQIKNQWCKDNNIPLIRIPYTHLDELCLEDLIPETSKFLIKGDS